MRQKQEQKELSRQNDAIYASQVAAKVSNIEVQEKAAVQ